MADVTVNISGDAGDISRLLNGVSGGFNDLENRANSSMGNIGNMFKNLGGSILSVGAILGGLAIGGLGAIGKGVFDVTAEFEKYNAVLETTFGSQEAANAAFAGLQDFAATTPFQLGEVLESYNKLTSRGIAPAKDALTSFGDFASRSGKGLDQLSEAILDISNTERWKEFGVQAKKAGDEVSLTFNGITKTVPHTEKAVAGAIAEFGKMEGVAGLMDKVSKTIGGQMSNLQDSFGQVGVAIGSKLSPIITPLIGQFSDFVQSTIPFITEGIDVLVNLFGTVLPDSMSELTKSPIVAFLQDTLVAQFENVKLMVGSVISVVQGLWQGLQNLWENSPMIQAFGNSVLKLIKTIQNAFRPFITFIKGTINALVGFFTENKFGIAIVEFIVDPIQDMVTILQDTFSFLGDLFTNLNEFFGFTDSTFEVPEIKITKKDKGSNEDVTTNEDDVSFDDLQAILDASKATGPGGPGGPSGPGGAAKKEKTVGASKNITFNIDSIIKESHITQAQDPLEIRELINRAVKSLIADSNQFA